MPKFTTLISIVFTIPLDNIDTDQIIPAGFLNTVTKNGLGRYLFYNWRFDKQGKLIKKNLFSSNNYQAAKILVAGNNFGCGSSREHAVWAIVDHGFKAVLSSSYGDIFYNNALKNGLLPVILLPSQLKLIMSLIGNNPLLKIEINLIKQQISLPAKSVVFKFHMNQFSKTRLLKGLDDLGYILLYKDKIKKYELSHNNFLQRKG